MTDTGLGRVGSKDSSRSNVYAPHDSLRPANISSLEDDQAPAPHSHGGVLYNNREINHEEPGQAQEAGEKPGDVVPEVINGVLDHRDVEAANLELERKNAGSDFEGEKDPNLVAWEGPDDPGMWMEMCQTYSD